MVAMGPGVVGTGRALGTTAVETAAVDPVGAHPSSASDLKDAPVSTYAIWAPFDGTILDREMIDRPLRDIAGQLRAVHAL